MVEGFLAHRDAAYVLLSFWGRLQSDERARALNAKLYRTYRQKTANILSEGQERGLFRTDVDVDAAAVVVVARSSGIATQVLFEPGRSTSMRPSPLPASPWLPVGHLTGFAYAAHKEGMRESDVRPLSLRLPRRVRGGSDEFKELVPELVMRLVDNYHFSVHVVGAQQGSAIPAVERAFRAGCRPQCRVLPRVGRRQAAPSDRLKRQSALLQRIHKNEVPPEKVESIVNIQGTVLDDPLLVNFAVTAPQMPHVISDLDHTWAIGCGSRSRRSIRTTDSHADRADLRTDQRGSASDHRVPELAGCRRSEAGPDDRKRLGRAAERAEVEATPEVPSRSVSASWKPPLESVRDRVLEPAPSGSAWAANEA